MIPWWRFIERRRCSHEDQRCVHGDEINAVGGKRAQWSSLREVPSGAAARVLGHRRFASVSAGVDLRDFVADVLHRCLEANLLDKLPAGCEAGYMLADALTAAGLKVSPDAPDLRGIARHVEAARRQLDLEVALGYGAESRAHRLEALSELDVALDLLLGKNRHRD